MSFYQSKKWYLSWLETIGKNNKLIIIVVRNRNNKLETILPLYLEKGSIKTLYSKILYPFAKTFSDYQPILSVVEDQKLVNEIISIISES